MKSKNNSHTESKLHTAISQIIAFEVENNLANKATVTSVNLSSDGSILKVYVSFMESKEKSLISLKNASGFIRSQIAKLQSTRRTPHLEFYLDSDLDKISKIEEIISDL